MPFKKKVHWWRLYETHFEKKNKWQEWKKKIKFNNGLKNLGLNYLLAAHTIQLSPPLSIFFCGSHLKFPFVYSPFDQNPKFVSPTPRPFHNPQTRTNSFKTNQKEKQNHFTLENWTCNKLKGATSYRLSHKIGASRLRTSSWLKNIKYLKEKTEDHSTNSCLTLLDMAGV